MMKVAKDGSVKTENKTGSGFTKEQLVKSRRYQDRRDLLSAVLEDGKLYSHIEVDKIIADWKKGKVK